MISTADGQPPSITSADLDTTASPDISGMPYAESRAEMVSRRLTTVRRHGEARVPRGPRWSAPLEQRLVVCREDRGLSLSLPSLGIWFQPSHPRTERRALEILSDGNDFIAVEAVAHELAPVRLRHAVTKADGCDSAMCEFTEGLYSGSRSQ